MTVEHRNRLLRDLVRRCVVLAGQREEIGEGEAGFEERQARAHDLHVGSRVALAALVDPGDEQPFPEHGFEQRGRDRRPLGQLGQRQQLFGRVDPGDRDRERRVGRVEVTAEEPPDQREGQPVGAQLADARQPLDVLGPVPGDPALTRGRRQQLALLVEADRVDRHVDPIG